MHVSAHCPTWQHHCTEMVQVWPRDCQHHVCYRCAQRGKVVCCFSCSFCECRHWRKALQGSIECSWFRPQACDTVLQSVSCSPARTRLVGVSSMSSAVTEDWVCRMGRCTYDQGCWQHYWAEARAYTLNLEAALLHGLTCTLKCI